MADRSLHICGRKGRNRQNPSAQHHLRQGQITWTYHFAYSCCCVCCTALLGWTNDSFCIQSTYLYPHRVFISIKLPISRFLLMTTTRCLNHQYNLTIHEVNSSELWQSPCVMKHPCLTKQHWLAWTIHVDEWCTLTDYLGEKYSYYPGTFVRHAPSSGRVLKLKSLMPPYVPGHSGIKSKFII